MIDAVDSELRQRFAALADRTDDSNWLEVRAHVRWPRPLLLLAAAVTLAVLVVAPAVALRGNIVRLFGHTAPVPQRVVKSFAALDEGVPPCSGSGVAPAKALEVLRTPVGWGQSAIVWLAPTSRGGFCSILELDGTISHTEPEPSASSPSLA